MTTVTTETALDRFIKQTRDLFASEPDPEKRWVALTPVLQEFLADPTVQEASAKWPVNVFTDRAENLLFYEDPDYGFVVNALKREPTGKPVEPPKHSGWRGIHDHAHIYTLYGVLVGHEMIERYRPVEGAECRADYVPIEEVGNFKVERGSVDLVRPYEDSRRAQPRRADGGGHHPQPEVRRLHAGALQPRDGSVLGRSRPGPAGSGDVPGGLGHPRASNAYATTDHLARKARWSVCCRDTRIQPPFVCKGCLR